MHDIFNGVWVICPVCGRRCFFIARKADAAYSPALWWKGQALVYVTVQCAGCHHYTRFRNTDVNPEAHFSSYARTQRRAAR